MKIHKPTHQHTNDALVHLNSMNKMGDYSQVEEYLHLSFWELWVKPDHHTLITSRDVLHSVIIPHGMYMYAHNRVLWTSSFTIEDSGYILLTLRRGEGSRLGKLINVSHRGLVWCPRSLTFHVE